MISDVHHPIVAMFTTKIIFIIVAIFDSIIFLVARVVITDSSALQNMSMADLVVPQDPDRLDYQPQRSHTQEYHLFEGDCL